MILNDVSKGKTLKEKHTHRLEVFENMALMRMCGPKRDKRIGGIMRSYSTCTLRQIGLE
jgi:hypothetical protein